MYNLEDLKTAQEEFEYWSELWAQEYSEKQLTNRYDTQAKKASLKLKEIEDYLKSNGVIAYTKDELANESLNSKYPNAKSRDVQQFNGVRYQKRFFPVKKSKSGKTVKEWRTAWINLDASD